MSNEGDPFVKEIQELLSKHTDTFYHENASDEFAEHLAYLPDPLDKVEHWQARPQGGGSTGHRPPFLKKREVKHVF